MANPSRARYRPLQSLNLLQVLGIISFLSIVIFWFAIGDKLDLLDIYLGSEEGATKHAFATILLPPRDNSTDSEDVDPYFTSTRMINYQLKHSKTTRSRRNIPFLVVVTSDIKPWKRKQLEREGATIVFVERISLGTDWIEPMAERWKDVMLKLRLFEFIDYDKILFLDADTYLLKPLDAIFNDPAARPTKSLTFSKEIQLDEAPLPSHYLFASLPEILHTTHPFPPHPWPRFNAGFFLFQPSLPLYAYYTSLLTLPSRFDSTYPEQNLLNYAHREWGNMPWGRLSPKKGWNVNLPNMNDVRMGVKSVHAKLWTEGNELQPVPKELRALWEGTRSEMEGFYGEMGARLGWLDVGPVD